MEDRIITHVDMDAFFASIEILKNPELKGKPVIVGGDPSKRGVVSTCSYEARKFGVRSAMSLFEAKKRCPQGIFVEGSYSLYGEYSDQVMQILHSFSPITEVVGIDEAYMDITEAASEYESPFKLCQKLRQAVLDKTGLTCSVGIGSNKLIAKIASSMAKPNGLYEIPNGCEVEFLATLPIESLPGIGIKTQAILNMDGIKTVKELQTLGMENLIQRYGTYGYYFYLASLGKDNRPVSTEDAPPKSIGAESTFEKDECRRHILVDELTHLFEKAYRRLRRHRMRARGLSIKLRFTDFKTITRAVTFETHTQDQEFLFSEMLHLFSRVWEKETPLRLIGMTFEKLTDSYWQPTFWDWQKENSPC